MNNISNEMLMLSCLTMLNIRSTISLELCFKSCFSPSGVSRDLGDSVCGQAQLCPHIMPKPNDFVSGITRSLGVWPDLSLGLQLLNLYLYNELKPHRVSTGQLAFLATQVVGNRLAAPFLFCPKGE